MLKLFKILAFLYVVACVALYCLQDRFIFNPEYLSEDYQYRIGEEVEIALDDDVSMNALFVKQTQLPHSKGVIMYLHGNRGSIRFGVYQIRHMQNLGYDIFIPDYRSYGKTEGSINSEKQLYQDVQKAYNYLADKYEEQQTVLVGYSLGTGMASYLASKNNPAQLILIAPFTSLTDIKNKYLWFMPDFLLKYKLPVKKFMRTISCPVTIVHGTHDRVVDYQFSEDLKQKFRDKIELVTAHREGHRGIIFAEILGETLYKTLVSSK